MFPRLVFLLQSFHLQPTGTPGTYYLQTTSNQGLPLSLSTSQGLPLSLGNNSTVTLTTGSSPSSHEHIILHSLSVRVCTVCLMVVCLFVFHTSPSVCLCVCVVCFQTDGLCSSDGVIIQTVTADPSSSDPLGQSQLVVETEGQSHEDHLEATSLLEGSEGVVTETQEPLTDDFTDKVLPASYRCFYFEKPHYREFKITDLDSFILFIVQLLNLFSPVLM